MLLINWHELSHAQQELALHAAHAYAYCDNAHRLERTPSAGHDKVAGTVYIKKRAEA